MHTVTTRMKRPTRPARVTTTERLTRGTPDASIRSHHSSHNQRKSKRPAALDMSCPAGMSIGQCLLRKRTAAGRLRSPRCAAAAEWVHGQFGTQHAPFPSQALRSGHVWEKITTVRWNENVPVGAAVFVFDEHPTAEPVLGTVIAVRRYRLDALTAEQAHHLLRPTCSSSPSSSARTTTGHAVRRSRRGRPARYRERPDGRIGCRTVQSGWSCAGVLGVSAWRRAMRPSRTRVPAVLI